MLKKLLWFAGGLVLGAAGGVVAAKFIFEEKAMAEAEKQIDEIKSYYDARLLAQAKAQKLNELKENYAETKVMLAQLEAEKEKTDYEQTVTDYTRPRMVEEDEDEWGDARRPRGAKRKSNPYASGKAPYYEEEGGVTVYPTEPDGEIHLISEQAYADDHREFEKMTIFWFVRDNVVTDEEYSPLEDEGVLGWDWREAFGSEDDPDVVHVRNPRIACDYEIIRQDRSYATTIPD